MGKTVEFSDVLLKPNEAAAFLQVSLSWLAKARATNVGPPFVRIGRCIRYSRAALLRWEVAGAMSKKRTERSSTSIHHNTEMQHPVQQYISRLGTYV